MTANWIEVCSECQKQLETTTDRSRKPCPHCGSIRRTYIADVNTAFGLKVSVSQEHKSIIFEKIWVLFAFLIVNILLDVLSIVFDKLWATWVSILTALLIDIIFFVIALIQAQIKIDQINKLFFVNTLGSPLALKCQNAWINIINFFKNVDQFIEQFRQPARIFLFSIALIFYLLTIVGLVKPALQVNFITVSTTLGGLVLAGSLFQRGSGSTYKKDLLNTAKCFILASILLLIFNVCFAVSEVLHTDPTKFDGSLEGIARGLIYWVGIISVGSGTWFFAVGLIDLLILLRKITDS